MKLNGKRKLPEDLAERIERLGEPTGKTMCEIVEVLGSPQRCSMNVRNVVENEPYMLLWHNKTLFYPLLFGLDYKCIGFEQTVYATLNSLERQLFRRAFPEREPNGSEPDDAAR